MNKSGQDFVLHSGLCKQLEALGIFADVPDVTLDDLARGHRRVRSAIRDAIMMPFEDSGHSLRDSVGEPIALKAFSLAVRGTAEITGEVLYAKLQEQFPPDKFTAHAGVNYVAVACKIRDTIAAAMANMSPDN